MIYAGDFGRKQVNSENIYTVGRNSYRIRSGDNFGGEPVTLSSTDASMYPKIIPKITRQYKLLCFLVHPKWGKDYHVEEK